MNHQDPLDELLLKWQVHAPPPASFRREVWERIAVQGRPQCSWMDRLAALFFRPAPLTACVALGLLAGALMAWDSRPESRTDTPSREQYLRSIDPFNPDHLVAAR